MGGRPSQSFDFGAGLAKGGGLTKFKHAIIYGDSHFPFQDNGALSVVKRAIIDIRPEVIIHIGDLIDCWSISDFDKDPARRDTLQDNIDSACAHLKDIYLVSPDAEHYYLEGNHEFRLTKTIQRMSEKQREVARLRVFQTYITWSAILHEAGVGMWQFVPAKGQARRRIFPKLIVKHGTLVRKWSGATARGEWERYGCSGVSGHTHRLGAFYHNDFNGAHGWAETGCTCDLTPEYCEDPDWQHGFLLLTFTADYSYFAVEPVYIQAGHAIVRDKRYNQQRVSKHAP